MAVTEIVVTVNVAVVAFAGTTTFAGTVAAAALELARATVRPPVGAALVRVTFPVTAIPPRTEEGVNTNEATDGGMTDNVALTVDPPEVAEMVAAVALATGLTVTENVTVCDPTGTVTLAGTVTLLLPLLIEMTAGAGTGADIVRVAVTACPPSATDGDMPSPTGKSGWMVKLDVADESLNPAEMLTNAWETGLAVTIENVPLVDPAAMVTVAGTVATGSDDWRLTTAPPAGAAPLSTSVPVTTEPATTDDELSDR
jgi:hypothetical protein